MILGVVIMDTYATSKGQIVIPVSLRKKYGIKAGTRIIVSDSGDSIRLTPVTDQYLRTLQGSFSGKGLLKTLLEERANDTKKEDQ